MNTKFKLFHLIRTHFLKLKLVDRCLVIFMVIILIQITITLFVHDQHSSMYSDLDNVFRTTAAAIFGYFLSASFTKNGKKCDPSAPTERRYHRLQITKQQIMITFSIGLFSLLVLILVRHFAILTADMQGTVSQLRDFVSGCIGFLVGSPCEEDKQGKG